MEALPPTATAHFFPAVTFHAFYCWHAVNEIILCFPFPFLSLQPSVMCTELVPPDSPSSHAIPLVLFSSRLCICWETRPGLRPQPHMCLFSGQVTWNFLQDDRRVKPAVLPTNNSFFQLQHTSSLWLVESTTLPIYIHLNMSSPTKALLDSPPFALPQIKLMLLPYLFFFPTTSSLPCFQRHSCCCPSPGPVSLPGPCILTLLCIRSIQFPTIGFGMRII